MASNYKDSETAKLLHCQLSLKGGGEIKAISYIIIALQNGEKKMHLGLGQKRKTDALPDALNVHKLEVGQTLSSNIHSNENWHIAPQAFQKEKI